MTCSSDRVLLNVRLPENIPFPSLGNFAMPSACRKSPGWFDPRNTPLGSCGHAINGTSALNFRIAAKVFLIGTYSLFAFVACALVVTLIILCFAEVGSRFDETGGPYLYARTAFGPTVGFEIGWLMWLARLTAFAANCNLLVNYLTYFWTGDASTFWKPTIIISVVAALTVINILGVRQAAIVSNGFTIGKLVPMIIFVAAGLFFINPAAYVLGPRPSTGAFSQSVLH
jgi:amino acid transporter